MEFLFSSQMKCPKSEIFPLIIGWGEWGKAILKETLLSAFKQFQFVDSMLFWQVR